MAEIESADSTTGDDGIDFALAAYREEGIWQLDELVHDVPRRRREPGPRAAPVPR